MENCLNKRSNRLDPNRAIIIAVCNRLNRGGREICFLNIFPSSIVGEQKASRALREASEVIGDSPAALQLRYLQVRLSNLSRVMSENNFPIMRSLQTLNTISAEKNSTIVFPLPIDMITYFMKSVQQQQS